MAPKRCKIHYRRLRRADDCFPDFTLSNALGAALTAQISGTKVIDIVQHRIAEVPNSEGYQRLLNDVEVTDTYVFGVFCLFAKGEMQALLRTSQEEGSVSLAELLASLEIAESKAPDGHEYLHGISYWMAIGDHVYHIQHTSLQSKALEEYLTWLLRDKTKTIETTHYVMLESKFDVAQTGTDMGEVKSIEIGGLVPETVGRAPVEPTITETSSEQRLSLADQVKAGWGNAKKIIEQLFGDVEAERIIASVPPDAALEVTVNIGYRATRRKFSKEFMGNVASGLRNAPDGEVIVRGKNGEIRGSDARLSQDMNVKKVHDVSGLLDLDDTKKQMLEVHRRFLHDGKVSDG